MLIIMHFYPFRQVSHTILINSYFIFIYFNRKMEWDVNMGSFTVARAIIVRLLFACHGLVSIWLLYQVTQEPRFWYLAASFGFLLVETTVTLVRKQGKEWKWWGFFVIGYWIGQRPSYTRISLSILKFGHPPLPPPLFDKRYWKRYLLLMEFKVKYLIIFDLL